MGHAICHDSFSTKMSQDEIFAIVNDRAIEEGDYHSSIDAITWYNKCFNTYEEAEDFIHQKDGFYAQLAVKYKMDKNYKPSKALEALWAKQNAARKAWREACLKPYFEDHKSATVGCKHCGSKIALKYLNSNFCPVCGTDLRPESVVNRLDRLREKSEQLETKCQEMEKAERLKNIAKAEEYWLVKTEYHV